MEKIFTGLFLIIAIIGGLAINNPSAEAADRWFFTGRERGQDEMSAARYYVREHVIESGRSICTVVAVNTDPEARNPIMMYVYEFYDFDAYGDARYIKYKNSMNGEVLDKGTISGTASRIVHELWRNIVLPDRQS